ncbi:MAG: TIGR01777 family protein [Anaerolineaceae bacterium]|nr:TIGR01777 family protein [Anaerolineaceae bacterium]
MRWIITGGTGLIGQALAANLAHDGHEAIVLTRSPQKAAGLPRNVRAVGWDGRTAEGWGALADGADCIVNLAGTNLAGGGLLPSRWTAQRKAAIRDSRLNAGRAVVDAVRRAAVKPAVVVQSSGVGYYGDRGDECVDEDSSPGDDFLARLAAEDWEPSTQPVEEMGVRRIVLRTGAVLDAREGALPRFVTPFRFFVGGRLGSGRQYLSWIHPADLVSAVRFLVEHPDARGAFNLVAPEPVTYAELARTLGRVLRRPALIPVPAFALRLLVGEVASVVLEGQRASSQRLLDLGHRFRFPALEPALQDVLR